MGKTGMTQNKIVVGILPTIHLYENDDPFLDHYSFVNNYVKRVYESGSVPIGILLNDGKIEEEILQKCDSFLWPGGSRMDKNLYKILVHAYKYKKPFLGICMGMQGMAVFSTILEELVKNNLTIDGTSSEDFIEIYQNMIKRNPVLELLEEPSMHKHTINRDNIDSARHSIKICSSSFLAQVYEKDTIDVVSLHGVVVRRTGILFQEIATASDGVCEAIESKDPSLFWLGVQYHPEITEQDLLISTFLKECLQRKKYLALINQTHKIAENRNSYIIRGYKSAFEACIDDSNVEEETLRHWLALKNDALNKGYVIDITSAYRTKKIQSEIFENVLNSKGIHYAAKYVAYPGYSEHESGLAIDFAVKINDDFCDSEEMVQTEAYTWVLSHLWEYGFILRYPQFKEDITGYSYEPWHIRYIGNVKLAKYIFDHNLTLEEFLGVQDA